MDYYFHQLDHVCWKIAKGPKKRLEVLKHELDKRAIKLNYMKLDIGVIMQKIFLRTCN